MALHVMRKQNMA